MRRFRFGEGRAIQFRLESQNLPNHPNINLPETRVDIISGGTITRAKNNRMLTLGLPFRALAAMTDRAATREGAVSRPLLSRDR
jgi:hypothetical protein